LLLKVKTGIFDMPDEVQGPVRDLLFRMLEKDPKKRITVSCPPFPEDRAHIPVADAGNPLSQMVHLASGPRDSWTAIGLAT
jgi:hypothetical protein